MKIEFFLLLISWVVSIYLLIWKIPKSKKRDAQITFLITQSIAWIIEFVQVYMQWVDFPYRMFPKATDMAFSLHYIVYPVFGTFFILLYPEFQKKRSIFRHYCVFIAGLLFYTEALEAFTDIIQYKHWGWYWNLLVFTVSLVAIRLFNIWFRKGLHEEKGYPS